MSEIKMLPLPKWCYADKHLHAGSAAIRKEVRSYARAVAKHNVAARDAEIEALRADAAASMAAMNAALSKVIEHRNARHAAEARAELLAEALREARDYVATALREERYKFAGHEDCSGIPRIEADLHKIDTALRDHDQEVGTNGPSLTERLRRYAEGGYGDWSRTAKEALDVLEAFRWRPFETAPSEEVLLYFPETLHYQRRIDAGNPHITRKRQPTHWMPLPKDPT